MAFPKVEEITRTPHIREIKITLFRTIDEADPDYQQASKFSIAVDDQFDALMDHLHSDVIPHAPPEILQKILDIMDWAWQKAENEVIPNG